MAVIVIEMVATGLQRLIVGSYGIAGYHSWMLYLPRKGGAFRWFQYKYPFVAIVGQEQMKLALVLNLISPTLSGVLIRSEKGTAKSTAVRALAEILPEVRVIKDYAFQLAPEDETSLCRECSCAECREKRLVRKGGNRYRQAVQHRRLLPGSGGGQSSRGYHHDEGRQGPGGI